MPSVESLITVENQSIGPWTCCKTAAITLCLMWRSAPAKPKGHINFYSPPEDGQVSVSLFITFPCEVSGCSLFLKAVICMMSDEACEQGRRTAFWPEHDGNAAIHFMDVVLSLAVKYTFPCNVILSVHKVENFNVKLVKNIKCFLFFLINLFSNYFDEIFCNYYTV